jgi:uncharacterized protein (DUF362 family)
MALLSRRDFIKTNLAGIVGLSVIDNSSLFGKNMDIKTRVVVVKTQDRRQGVTAIMETMDYTPMAGKRVLIKPNFNTADPTPGSTHNDTLEQLITELRSRGGEDITIGESSGPPATSGVMEQKGIIQLAEELNVTILNYEQLTSEEWVHFNPGGIHWANGYSLPRAAVESEYFVSTCCLKTHGSGGVFTMSLKLAVGLTPKSIRGGMHALSTTHMRRMIAELNLGYKPDLIVLDGIEAFTDGGPSRGTLKQGNVFIGGTDRIAVDAVGLAVLKDLGSNNAIMGRNIFEQEQIQRAVELGLGISSPDQIELITPDESSRIYAEKLREILDESGPAGIKEVSKLPSAYRISNFPNPFNPVTTLRYTIPNTQKVSLKVFNALGQEVATLVNNVVKTQGVYQAVFHGHNLPSGMYYYTLSGSGFSKTGKMMLVR